jgi:hypothetical protein
MKVGDYVRTEYGIIAKITDIIEDLSIDCDRGVFDLGNMLMMEIPWNFKDEYIIKSSPSIIDLIEIGDYVNDLKITSINEPSMANCYKRLLYAKDEEGYLIERFDEEDIKSIVTKEQFESMKYEVK